MASWYVQTDVGNLFIPDHYNASGPTARSMARQWARKFAPDLADEMKVNENSSGFGAVKMGDSVWGGYGVPAGEVNPRNFVQIQDNVTSGKKWDFRKVTDTNMGGFGGYNPDDTDTEITESRDLVDPIQGFLKGLGFDFGQGGSAARDFQKSQGALGQGTFQAQRAQDWYEDDIPGGGPQDSEQFARGLGINANNRFGNIGSRALSNLGSLSGLFGRNTPGDYTGSTSSLSDKAFADENNANRRFVNPWSQDELEAQGLADLLTGAFQGAGVSPLYNQGVNRYDVQGMFTDYAAKNPNIGAGNELDQNFIKYAADQLGLSRFFG